MIVTVVKRIHDGWTVTTPTIEIADTCPVCGGPRGEPYWHHFCEDGDWFTVTRWDNPCGHLDKYADVLKELNPRTPREEADHAEYLDDKTTRANNYPM